METHVLLFCLGMMERIRRGAALRGLVSDGRTTQLVTAPTISSGLLLGRSSTSRKAYEVYFQMDPTSSLDSYGAKNYRQNDVRTSILGLSLLYLIQPTRGLF